MAQSHASLVPSTASTLSSLWAAQTTWDTPSASISSRSLFLSSPHAPQSSPARSQLRQARAYSPNSTVTLAKNLLITHIANQLLWHLLPSSFSICPGFTLPLTLFFSIFGVSSMDFLFGHFHAPSEASMLPSIFKKIKKIILIEFVSNETNSKL